MKFIAKFYPQAWINNQAIVIDPAGPVHWDVTTNIRSAGLIERNLYLKGRNDTSDGLARLPQAPNWIKSWAGPFEVCVVEMVDEDAQALLESQRSVVETMQEAGPAFGEQIPHSDGLYCRGYRDALESMQAAMWDAGLGSLVITNTTASAIKDYTTNKRHKGRQEEIHEVLMVSTAHLHPIERKQFAEGSFEGKKSGVQLLMSNEDGGLLYFPGPDMSDDFPSVTNDLGLFQGIRKAIARARQLGAHYVRFDSDGPILPTIPTYSDA